MRDDPLLCFFNKTRRLSVHSEPGNVRKHISVRLEPGAIRLTGALIETKVTRARPWFRRRPAILWQDSYRRFAEHARRIERRVREPWERRRRRRAARRREPGGGVAVRFLFDDCPFPDRDAFELLDDYLRQLDQIVGEAEAGWG